MKINIKRSILTEKSTISKLYIDDVFYCYTLEDTYRAPGTEKIKGSTCVPNGMYKVVLRQDGTIWNGLCKRFDDIGQERGILHIYNITGCQYDIWYATPGIDKYAWVLIHPGNTPDDTLGCLMPGMSVSQDRVNDSVVAYKLIYPIVADALTAGESVTITYEVVG